MTCSDSSRLLLGWATSSVGGVVVWLRGRVDGSAGIVVLTAWYINRVVTDKGEFIEYCAIRASRKFWFDTIIADVVFAAILRVNVEHMITVWDSSLGLGSVLLA